MGGVHFCGNSRTLTADRSPILLNLNANAGAANYTVFRDVDGNGRIQTADLSPISLNLNDRLPTAEPLTYTFGVGAASADSQVQLLTASSDAPAAAMPWAIPGIDWSATAIGPGRLTYDALLDPDRSFALRTGVSV